MQVGLIAKSTDELHVAVTNYCVHENFPTGNTGISNLTRRAIDARTITAATAEGEEMLYPSFPACCAPAAEWLPAACVEVGGAAPKALLQPGREPVLQ
jgi:hypothetical protein